MSVQGPPPTGSAPPQPTGGPPPISGLVTAAQLRTKLGELLGRLAEEVYLTDQGAYALRQGTAQVFITGDQLNDNHTVVTVFAMTNLEIPASPEFFKWIATNSDNSTFGHLSLRERPNGTFDVVLSHRLLGTYIDFPELQGALFYVATTADGIDEAIKEKFGGRTYHESPEAATGPDGKPDPGYL